MPTPTCRHLHTDGRPCGSPALRGEPFCFHHHAARKPMPKRDLDGYTTPQLPAPDDFLAIQRGIGEVLRLLATASIAEKLASTLLRGLAIASANLAQHHRHEARRAAQAVAAGTPAAQPVTDYITDPLHGTLAPEPAEALQQALSAEDQAPLPNPIPLLTPDPSRANSYDEAMFLEIHRGYQATLAQRTEAYEQRKSRELEALYEDRYTQREAELQTRFEARLNQIPTQQNQYLETHEQTPEHHLALAS